MDSREAAACAILCSGGLDSAILLGETAGRGVTVQPLYIRCGLIWEDGERRHLGRFLEAIGAPGLQPLFELEVPVSDLYGDHWSITGRGVPDAASEDDAVYLPGRNVLLLSKALLWCHLHGWGQLHQGVLASNPFPDATAAFFNAMEEAVNRSVGGEVRLRFPYATLSKREVMRRGKGLPLEWTFSCIRPVDDQHCGRCNKCAERRRAFAQAGLVDPTHYRE